MWVLSIMTRRCAIGHVKKMSFPMLLAAALSVGHVHADAIDCSKSSTTPDINECASIEQEKVEAELNATYKQALAFLDESDPLIKEDAAKAKTKLMEAQRAW